MTEMFKASPELDNFIDKTNEEKLIEYKKKLLEIYDGIIERLKFYCDLKEEYYPIITLWIIGTYFHKDFETYPYLFINAMRGSGKSRLLKLIAYLSNNGKVENDLSEAVLFRTALNKTFCIDEFEFIGSKEKGTLRTLLNSAYKKGTIVERAKKKKDSSDYEVEKFELYAPICMANIWGMEGVLNDRCIPIILEKSDNPMKTKLMELFEYDVKLNSLKTDLVYINAALIAKNDILTTYKEWNIHLTTLYTNYTNTTLTTPSNLSLFSKILKTSLNSRNLELFFSLFILSEMISIEILDLVLKIAESIIEEKKVEDLLEDTDISLIEFISTIRVYEDFIQIKDITKQFKSYLENDEEVKKSKEMEWLNNYWMGRALKRLVLIKKKRRVGRGIEVVLNYEKAREKIKMFKPIEEQVKVTEESI